MRRALVIGLAVLLALLLAAPADAGVNRNFVAPMDGRQENPPVDSNATGVAKFNVERDGAAVGFKLIVANIDNVFAAHIHCGPAGVNGPVGVTLFAVPPPNLGAVNGILAQGTITAPDPGNGCGWSDVDALVAAMEAGVAYVNVHTMPGTPTGEIRGQIR
jgi:hypothetical protein